MSSLVAFFSLTFAVSWGCFMAAARVPRDASAPTDLPALATALIFLGTIAPALVALTLTARRAGRDGLADLFERLTQWQVQAHWYLFAVGYLIVVKLTVALVYRVALGEWPQFGSTPWYLIVAAIAISTPVQSGEEIGWRGYALPRLAARFGFARAGILLGVVWAVWHLPLFVIPGVDNYGQSFMLFTLAVTGVSVAMTWLYMRTAGSLLLVMVMHSAINQTSGIVRTPPAADGNSFTLSAPLVAWLTVAFVWIIASFILVLMRRDATISHQSALSPQPSAISR